MFSMKPPKTLNGGGHITLAAREPLRCNDVVVVVVVLCFPWFSPLALGPKLEERWDVRGLAYLLAVTCTLHARPGTICASYNAAALVGLDLLALNCEYNHVCTSHCTVETSVGRTLQQFLKSTSLQQKRTTWSTAQQINPEVQPIYSATYICSRMVRRLGPSSTLSLKGTLRKTLVPSGVHI